MVVPKIPKYKDLPTHDPKVRVHITYALKEGGCALSGYAIDERGIRIDGSKTLRRYADTLAAIPTKEQHLAAAVISAVTTAAAKRRKKLAAADDDGQIVKAFKQTVDAKDPITPSWGESTRKKRLTYFERNILPVIAAHKGSWLAEDTAKLRDSLIDRVLENKGSDGALGVAANTVDNSLAASATIYTRMREYFPELPEIDLRPRPYTRKRVQKEQYKSIPDPIREKFVAALEVAVDSEPRKVMSATAMFDSGLRTAEAAAIHPNEFIRRGGCVSIPVCYQEKDGRRDPILKSDNSYRLVPASFWGSNIIDRCIARMGEIGPDEPMCDSHELSAWIRTLLFKCGFDEALLSAAERAQDEFPDCDSKGRPVRDLTAYILRRDWASRARNICGMSQLEIDYLLGHKIKIPKKARMDFRHTDMQAYLAYKLERYVCSRHITHHPWYDPIELTHGSDEALQAFGGYKLFNASSEPLRITLDLEAAVNAETIAIAMPEGSVMDYKKRVINTKGKRDSNPVIGVIPLTDEEGDRNG